MNNNTGTTVANFVWSTDDNVSSNSAYVYANGYEVEGLNNASSVSYTKSDN